MCESSTFSEKSRSITSQPGSKKFGPVHRIFDGLFALSVLIFLSPFLILLAAAIVFDSGLPIFFRQSRVVRTDNCSAFSNSERCVLPVKDLRLPLVGTLE